MHGFENKIQERSMVFDFLSRDGIQTKLTTPTFFISKTFILIAFLIFNNWTLWAQVIQNGSSYKLFTDSSYVRLNYENDLFSGSDEYYTQGVNLEWVSTNMRPLRHILVAPKKNSNLIGLALEQDVYTPSNITSSTILQGDRPFAATLTLKAFAISMNSDKRSMLTSALAVGVIGPAAGGYETQKSIHEVTNGVEPQGWQYQIENDLVLNYRVGFEKNIIHSNIFLLNGLGMVDIGTLESKITAGGTFILGKLNDVLKGTFGNTSSSPNPKKFNFHLYAQPVVNAVLYDATLQGGLIFNPDSPYVVESSEMAPITFQGTAGIVIEFESLYLQYSQSVISEEFAGAVNHRWGGISVGLKF